MNIDQNWHLTDRNRIKNRWWALGFFVFAHLAALFTVFLCGQNEDFVGMIIATMVVLLPIDFWPPFQIER